MEAQLLACKNEVQDKSYQIKELEEQQRLMITKNEELEKNFQIALNKKCTVCPIKDEEI